MSKFMRLAMEGANVEVVKGMFVAVPITDVEHVRTIVTEGLSTEALTDKIKEAGKKAWEIIAKIIAGFMAAVKAIANTLRGRTTAKEFTQEFQRHLELSVKEVTNLKGSNAQDKVDSVIKKLNLVEKFAAHLNQDQLALISGADYVKNMRDVVAFLNFDVNPDHLVEDFQILLGDIKGTDISKMSEQLATMYRDDQETSEKLTKFLEELNTSDQKISKDTSHIKDLSAGLISQAQFIHQLFGHHQISRLAEKYSVAYVSVRKHIEDIGNEVKKKAEAGQLEPELASSIRNVLKIKFDLLAQLARTADRCLNFFLSACRLIIKEMTFLKQATEETIRLYQGDEKLVEELKMHLKVYSRISDETY